MGVDCKIMLPGNVRIRDVADIIGILSGKKVVKEDFKHGPGWHAVVEGIELKNHGSIPTCQPILVKGPFPQHIQKYRGRQETIYVLYHYEPGREWCGGRLLLPPSTNFWVAVGKRLVDFFGGKVDYNDCDDVDTDYEVPAKSDKENSPEDGDDWYDLQNRLLDLEPLTEEEIEHAYTYISVNEKVLQRVHKILPSLRILKSSINTSLTITITLTTAEAIAFLEERQLKQ